MKTGRGTPKRTRSARRLWANVPDLIEAHAKKQSLSRIDELAQIFIHATNVSALSMRAELQLIGVDGEGFLGHGIGQVIAED